MDAAVRPSSSTFPCVARHVTDAPPFTVHASCVVIGSHAVLLRGPSGSGKSDLALRLIDRGAKLVSDDYTVLTPAGGKLVATAPSTIKGQMEVRGLGIIHVSVVDEGLVALCVDLRSTVERYPLVEKSEVMAGIQLPLVMLNPFEASAPIKVELALGLATGREPGI